MSRLCASVNLLIVFRMEPLRVKRLSPQYRALRDLLKRCSFLLSIPLTQIPPQRSGFLHPQVFIRYISCVFLPCMWFVLCSSAAEKEHGNPSCYPRLGVYKPWLQPRKQTHGQAKLAVLPQTLNLIPAKLLHIVIHLELAVWLTSRRKQHFTAGLHYTFPNILLSL